MRRYFQLFACFIAASASACLSPGGGGSTDAGLADGSVDGGFNDAGLDAGVDAGPVMPTTTGLDDPSLLAIEGTTVFWTNLDDPGEVQSFDFAGDAGAAAGPDAGNGITTIASMQANPYAIAVDSVNVFWLNYGTCGGASCVNSLVYKSDGSLVEAALAGGAPLTLATNQPQPLGLALSPGEKAGCPGCPKSVFWVNGGTYDDLGNYNSDGAVLSVAVGGGAPTTLFGSQISPDAIAVDGNNVYWTNAGTFDAATGAYNNDGAVLQGSLSASVISTLATGQSYPAAIAVDSAQVFWTNAGQFDSAGNALSETGSVRSVPIGGTTVTTLAAGQNRPGALVVQDPNVYWVNGGVRDGGSGSVVELPTAGGIPNTLVGDASHPVGIAVSSDGVVYYSDPGTIGGTDGGVFSVVP